MAMAPTRHYDEDLRAIGQALEARDISVFELKHLADWYVIQGTPEQTGSLSSKNTAWLRRLRSGSTAESLTLTLADVEQLSHAGRAKRSNPERLTNFQSVPNTLRTIGAYLDSREVELIELHKRRISITLSYRDKAGRERKEDRPIFSFYKLFLELRENRSRESSSAATHQ